MRIGSLELDFQVDSLDDEVEIGYPGLDELGVQEFGWMEYEQAEVGCSVDR